MQSAAIPDPRPRVASPDRWVQGYVSGRLELDSLPTVTQPLLVPARNWINRWRGLTRPERLRLIDLLGRIGDPTDADWLLALGESIIDDPNVPFDWREAVLDAIDTAFGRIEPQWREHRRLAAAAG